GRPVTRPIVVVGSRGIESSFAGRMCSDRVYTSCVRPGSPPPSGKLDGRCVTTPIPRLNPVGRRQRGGGLGATWARLAEGYGARTRAGGSPPRALDPRGARATPTGQRGSAMGRGPVEGRSRAAVGGRGRGGRGPVGGRSGAGGGPFADRSWTGGAAPNGR